MSDAVSDRLPRRLAVSICRLTFAALGIASLVPAPASAQGRSVEQMPARPRLPPGADSNDATAYHALGNARLSREPAVAAAAFYWAARLDPANADALYARRVALLFESEYRLRAYVEDDTRRRPSRESQYLDSLQLRAIRLDPFLREDLEADLLTRYVEVVAGRRLEREGVRFSQSELAVAANVWLRDYSPDLQARFAYCSGRYDEALHLWADFARRHPRNSLVHAERARAFYHKGVLDSARASMIRALESARRADADSVRLIYESKAVWEYALGQILDRQGNTQAAREAYERALIEDLSYFPAHLQLGRIHITAGDTAAAMREFERAVQSAEDEYLPRATYGYRLARLGQLDTALIHLRRAVAAEPFAAEARIILAAVLDAVGERDSARASFEAFLARARRDDPRVVNVRRRLAQMSTP